jgi:hypothetical protein
MQEWGRAGQDTIELGGDEHKTTTGQKEMVGTQELPYIIINA